MTPDTVPPIFVFVRPQLGVNLGAAARGMKNFGIQSMRLVAPPDSWLTPDVVARASGAAALLETALSYGTVAEALTDCTTILATTVRERGLWKTVQDPRTALERVRRSLGPDQRLAILFGPERTGLANDEIALANTIITVPTLPTFRSMNIAQCATLLAYEWHMSSRIDPDPATDDNAVAPATSADRNALAEGLIADLTHSDYFGTDADRPGRILYLRNLINRLDLTKGEVKALHRIRKSLRDGPTAPKSAHPDAG